MQVRTEEHNTNLQIEMKENFETRERSLNVDMNRFFKLFEDSTFEGSRTAACEIRKIAKRPIKQR
jgi:hypothetical protein